MSFNHCNDPRFIEIMTALAEASGQETTELKERIYAQGLDDIPITDIERAAWSMIKTRTLSSFPKIGELREMIVGKLDDVAEVEAAKVWTAVCGVGGYKSVAFDDAVTQAVIEHAFGGWPRLCSELLIDQQKWFIKDFVKFYAAFSRQGLRVTGVMSGRGTLSGDGVKLIGDKAKALLIAESSTGNSRFEINDIPENVRCLIGQTFRGEEDF